MKVVTGSDLHLEHYFLTADFGLVEHQLKNHYGADVLILAGDIFDTNMIFEDRLHDVFGKLNDHYPYILLIMGNHEHYHGDFAHTARRIRHFCSAHYNTHFLDKEGITIDGKRFFGGTMWTDLKDEDPMVMWDAKVMMNDYQCVGFSTKVVNYKAVAADGSVTFHSREGTFQPEDSVHEHILFKGALKQDMEAHPDLDYFVITHHSPTMAMCNIELFGDDNLNYAYHCTDMDDLILDNPRIKKWTFGHTHGRKRMMMGDTELILNARGYAMERMSITFDFEEVQF